MTGPSLRFTTASLSGDMSNTGTEYICGRNTRSETRSCSGSSDTTRPTNVRYEYGPLRAYILNRDLNYVFELEIDKRIYTAFQANEFGSPKWIKPRRIGPQKRTGRTVHSHMETVDTGERREMFGYPARRVITRSRETRDSQLLNESETDGWYIDPPAAWLNLYPPAEPGAFSYLISGTAERDDYKFTEAGNRETGFVLLTMQTHKSYFDDEAGTSSTHETVHQQEVTEFSEAQLTPDLFVPPRDFKRMQQLPDGVRYPRAFRMRLRWEMLKDSLALPNRIARFIA